MENFAEYVAQERERLMAKRHAALEARHQADADLAAVESEFHAIDAYEAAKSGKRVSGGAGGSNGRHRQNRGTMRSDLLSLIGSSSGLKRREILESLGVKGDKSGEMAVSNALSALYKTGRISRSEDGVYFISGEDTATDEAALSEAEPVAA
jgi:hypothetical protein